MPLLNHFLDEPTHNEDTVEHVCENLVKVLQQRRTTGSILQLGLSDFCDYSDEEQVSNRLCSDITQQIRHFEQRLDNINVEPCDSNVSGTLRFKISACMNNTCCTFYVDLTKPHSIPVR